MRLAAGMHPTPALVQTHPAGRRGPGARTLLVKFASMPETLISHPRRENTTGDGRCASVGALAVAALALAIPASYSRSPGGSLTIPSS
jgi:hypothetical protein